MSSALLYLGSSTSINRAQQQELDVISGEAWSFILGTVTFLGRNSWVLLCIGALDRKKHKEFQQCCFSSHSYRLCIEGVPQV